MSETILSQVHSEPPEAVAAPLKDVWSRSGSKYRIRAIVLLGVNVLLFAGVASFAYWLRTGERTPSPEGYWDELTHTFLSVPMSERTGVSLGSFLIDPINVQDVPAHIPIVGLLMAALIAIPVLVSILYRFWSSLPFVAVIGFLAVMPWLALTLLGSCLIASVRPFRTRFRFTSALLGLVPVVLYLILAWEGTGDAVGGNVDPVDRIKFIAPWVMAIVAATVLFAVVLLIARVVDYRPGAIAPLLAVMFGLPVALFEFQVGRDELYYRILETLSHAQFQDRDASVELEQTIFDRWASRPSPRQSLEATREIVEEQWLMELVGDVGPLDTVLARHQKELTDRCDSFIRHFPRSQYAVNALYIKARTMDKRFDPLEFRRTKWIRFYDDFPQSRSRQAWRMVLENDRDGLPAAVALLRMAQLDARDAKIDRALDGLVRLRGTLTGNAPKPQLAAGSLHRLLGGEEPAASLGISPDRILLELDRLEGLLRSNRDPIYYFEPLSGPVGAGAAVPYGFLDLDPRSEGYVDSLRALKRQYPSCQIEDNIDLEIAKHTTPLEDKIRLLSKCLSDFPRRDAIPEALYRLAVAQKQSDHTAKGEETFQRLFREFPGSPWARAAERLTLAVPIE
ncbi:MAG: hypothetical protein V3S47_06915 [Acidobacteriota bacterium]